MEDNKSKCQIKLVLVMHAADINKTIEKGNQKLVIDFIKDLKKTIKEEDK
jgi:hypothetical protein